MYKTRKCDNNFFRETEKLQGLVDNLNKGMATVSKKGAHCAYM